MENASKAVIMAGGVLIAVAVISLALYAYGLFSGYAESSEQMLTANQIQSFNRFYESYPEGVDAIRGVDVINIINKAKDDEIQNVSAMPGNLTGADQSRYYLDTYTFSVHYDSQGKIDSVTIN